MRRPPAAAAASLPRRPGNRSTQIRVVVGPQICRRRIAACPPTAAAQEPWTSQALQGSTVHSPVVLLPTACLRVPETLPYGVNTKHFSVFFKSVFLCQDCAHDYLSVAAGCCCDTGCVLSLPRRPGLEICWLSLRCSPPSSMGTAPEARARSGRGNKPHLLVVPYPAQGHMLPLLDLASLLTARGIDLTVAVTAGNVKLLAPLLAACPSVATVVLSFPSTPFLPAGCGENTKDLPAGHLFRPFMASLAALRAPLLSWCKAQPRGVTAVVSDSFTGWTVPLAEELGVPHVTFMPTSALYLAVSNSLWRHMPGRRCLDDADEVVTFSELPGSPSFPWHDLSWLFRMHVAGDEVSETIRQIFLWNLESSCFVVNSFAALEAAYLERPLPDLTAKRVLAVGALSDAVNNCKDRGGKPTVAPADVTAWLDAFGDGSVVYVCFGTQWELSPAQAACVADALALSSAAFVWAVRSGTAAVPEGFEAATAARGMVIRGWAPQVEVLRHRAVGWFLTHCGWNSVLEASAAGVAMLAWPMSADQFMNAWLLVEAGVALPVAKGADTVPDAGEMASTIAAAVAKEGKPVRERAGEFSRKAATAVAEGGTSNVDLEELVRMLSDVV